MREVKYYILIMVFLLSGCSTSKQSLSLYPYDCYCGKEENGTPILLCVDHLTGANIWAKPPFQGHKCP